jgi:hypothetical protein
VEGEWCSSNGDGEEARARQRVAVEVELKEAGSVAEAKVGSKAKVCGRGSRGSDRAHTRGTHGTRVGSRSEI